jgi:hypothetical protein
MPTVEEILKQSGLSEEKIKELDANAIKAFTTVLSTATAAQTEADRLKNEAEVALRAQQQMYQDEIAPALDGWGTEKANLVAERDYYRSQNQAARAGGFVPADAPGYQPPANGGAQPARDGNGQFVAGGNPVPGSPKFVTPEDMMGVLAKTSYAQNEYFRLFNKPLPDNIDTLALEAHAQRLDFKDYVERKYNFAQRRQELTTAEKQQYEAGIRKDEREKTTKELMEKVSNNPDIRVGTDSQYSNISQAVKTGERKDPLSMSANERHRSTQVAIAKDVAANVTA